MVDETIKATGAPSPWCHHTVGKAFGKDTLPTSDCFTAEPADSGYKLHRSSCQGQIIEPTTVVAVNPVADRPTTRAPAVIASAAGSDVAMEERFIWDPARSIGLTLEVNGTRLDMTNASDDNSLPEVATQGGKISLEALQNIRMARCSISNSRYCRHAAPIATLASP